MPEFTIKVTQVYNITARNEEQAGERAVEVSDNTPPAYSGTDPATGKKLRSPRWLGDMQEAEAEVEEC